MKKEETECKIPTGFGELLEQAQNVYHEYEREDEATEDELGRFLNELIRRMNLYRFCHHFELRLKEAEQLDGLLLRLGSQLRELVVVDEDESDSRIEELES